MSNIVTVNSGSAIGGSLKAGRVSISTDSSVTPSSGGKTWYNMINPAGGYTFISDPKIQGYNDGPPIIYPTQTTLPSDILATINGLPDRRGSVAFDNVWDALIWVQSTGKYFILDKTLSGTVTDNIIFAVDFSQPSSYPQSGSTAFDLSGNDNNGTLGSGIGFNSKGWVNFNGTQTSNYNIAVPIDRAELGNNMSVEATFKYEGAAGDGYRPIIGGNDPGAGTEIFFGKNSGNTNFGVQDGNYAGSFVTNYNVFDGEWHHMVYTYDNGTGKIYLDGALRNSGAFTKANNAEQIYIGAEVQEGYWWDGDISQVKYYTKTLSSPEILQNYYQSPIVTDGLVLAVDAGNLVSYENGSTTTYSLTGSDTGTLNNGVDFDSGYGGTWKFDGTDDYISFPSNASNNITGDITCEAWFFIDSDPGDWVRVLGKGNSTNRTYGVWYNYSSDTFLFQRYNSGGGFSLTQGSAGITLNKWYHIVGTSNGSSHTLYINGQSVATNTTTGPFYSSTETVNIGDAPFHTEHHGYISTSRLYNRGLTAAEVQQNYNANYPRFNSSRDISKNGLGLQISPSNPSSYRSGTIITDLSGNGRDGTLINSPTYLVENGGIIEFDGTDDWIDFGSLAGTFISDPSLSGGVISFSIWTYAIGGYYIMSSGAQTSSRGIAISYQNGSPFISIKTGAKAQSYAPGGNFPTGQWIHWVAVSDNTNWVIYKDGVQISSQALNNATVADAQTKLTIGVPNNFTTGYYFQGKIGDVAFWDTALTSQEVSNLFTTQSPRYRVQLPRTVTDSLALTLDAGDTTSYPREGTTWYDRSGNGNNGTLTNGPIYEFVNGGVIDFDGTDDYVGIGVGTGINQFSGDFAISAWVMRVTGGGSYGNIIGDYYTNSTATTNEWQIMIGPNSEFNLYKVGAGYIISNTSSGFSNGTWINIVVTRVGSIISMYANSNLIATATNSTTFGTSTGNLNIGIDGNNSSEPFTGKMSTLQVYHQGLSSSEVLENYKSTRSRFGTDGIPTSGLTLHWDASNIDSYDGTSTTISDLSGNGNNGTLYNGVGFDGECGGALVFDGIDDYINSSTLDLRTTDCTVIGVSRYVSINQGSYLGGGRIINAQSNNWLMGHWDRSAKKYFAQGWVSDSSGTEGMPDTSLHFYHTFNKPSTDSWSFYIDNVLDSGPNSNGSQGPYSFTIGRYGPGASEYSNSKFYTLLVYSRILSDSEVTQIYTHYRNRFGLD